MSSTTDAVIEDTPTERTRFDQLEYERQLAFLEVIRDRRLAQLRVYEDLVAKKQASANDKLIEKAAKLQGKIQKKLTAAAKAIEEVEAMARDIMAMKLQLENE